MCVGGTCTYVGGWSFVQGVQWVAVDVCIDVEILIRVKFDMNENRRISKVDCDLN